MRHISWGRYLFFLIVIVFLIDIAGVMIAMFLPSVEAEREKYRERQRVENPVPAK